MDDDGGALGQAFMRSIEPVAARVPYLTCMGNHEAGSNTTGALQHYLKRFGKIMPGNTDGVFFSFDVGYAHVVSISSEPYFWQTWSLEAQFNWLKDDLKKVDRNKTPFIIVVAHRPMYCSNSGSDDCTTPDSVIRTGISPDGISPKRYSLEPLFREYGVDIFFAGHEHSYERTYPVYNYEVFNNGSDTYINPQGTVHVIAGAAGCVERHSNFIHDIPLFSASRSEVSCIYLIFRLLFLSCLLGIHCY
jgi:hypothetical protein